MLKQMLKLVTLSLSLLPQALETYDWRLMIILIDSCGNFLVHAMLMSYSNHINIGMAWDQKNNSIKHL